MVSIRFAKYQGEKKRKKKREKLPGDEKGWDVKPEYVTSDLTLSIKFLEKGKDEGAILSRRRNNAPRNRGREKKEG